MIPRYDESCTEFLYEGDDVDTAEVYSKKIVPGERKLQIVWLNVIIFSYLHLGALYGLFLCFTSAKIATIFFGVLMHIFGCLGITAGVHRLWSHRSYKAKWPLNLFLLLCFAGTFQGPAIIWARDHRGHHKYTETDGDPYNVKRGLFFSHIGWLLVKKHPDVKLKGKGIDVSDLYEDPMLRFQKRHYMKVSLLVCFAIPAVVPWYFWGETLSTAFFVCSMLRCAIDLNITWMINSVAHRWGDRPYDRYIYAVEHKILSFLIIGEGWHNYHHTFPWDYKTGELSRSNFTTVFLDICAQLGLAYDLKSVSGDAIQRRVQRTGDGSHAVWGWGDKDQTQQERDEAVVTAKIN